MSPGRPPQDREVRRATVSFLQEQGPHDAGEDLHPPRLDETEARLDAALKRDERREKADSDHDRDDADA